MNDEVKIFTFDKKFRDKFRELNIEWLEKYFKVEPVDEELLRFPEKIIENGGEIFFAEVNGSIAGTCALLKIDNDSIELAKMAVTEKEQGKQIGKKLGIAAISYAKSKNFKTLILESNRILIPALNLYKKLGFEEVPGYISSKYARSNIKMKLNLYT